MDGGISDLFRVQKAAMDAHNPMAPEIGASTPLPPQLLQLVKQSVANQQAEMRMQGQAGQAQPQPTVADAVRQKSAALMQHQQQQQAAQQNAMQQLMQAQQQPIRFAEGGVVPYAPYGHGNSLALQALSPAERERLKQEYEALDGRSGAPWVLEQLAFPFKRLMELREATTPQGIREAREREAELLRESRRGQPSKSGIAALKDVVAPAAAGPEVVAPAGSTRTDNERREGAEKTAAIKAPGTPRQAGGIDTLRQAVAPAVAGTAPVPGGEAADGPWGKILQQIMQEKAQDPAAAGAAAMALRERFNLGAQESQFLKDQLARRDAEIAKAGAERPGITQILTAMARAARNDPKGGWGAGLLGAAEYSQAQAEQRKAKVLELQQAKDVLLASLAKLQDAKSSGNFQEYSQAQAAAQKAAQDLQAKKADVAKTMGAQEMQNQGAESRLGRELSSREREGATDRTSREKIAASNNAATIKAAGMRQGGDNDMSKRYDRAVDNAQKRLDTMLKTPQGMMLAPDKIDALRARVLREEMAALGLQMPGAVQSAGPATGAPGGLDLSQWGKPQEVKR